MDQTRMKMVRVFESNSQDQLENIDPLTHLLPPSRVLLAPPATQIMEKVRDALALVTTIGFSSEFFLLSRRILLLDTFTQEEGPKRHNAAFNQLYLSNKIEIVPMEPIQWIYGEIKLRKEFIQQSLSPIRQNANDFIEPRVGISLITALLGSVIVLLQIKDSSMASQIVNVLKDSYQKLQQIEGSFPKILIFYNSKNIGQSQLKYQLQLLKGFKIQIQLIGTQECQNWDEQFRLIGKLKPLIQKLRPKVIDKISINARLMILLWSTLANQQEFQALQAWQQAQNIHVQEQSQNAFQHYMSRIEQLTEGQTLLSCQFFREVEAKVRSDVMKQVTERTGALSQREDIMKTERRLLEMREEIESRNQKAVIEWGKDFLREAWASVQKKLGKQIKSISSLKQEAQIFIDFFRKKSDNYLSLELMTLLIDFLVPKLMDSALNISNILVVSQQDQLKTVQNQMITLSSETKELRKKLGKEEGEVSRRIIDLKEKNSQLQANCKLLEQALDQSKQETCDLRERLEEKAAKLIQDYQNVLRQKQKILQQNIQKAELNIKATSLLESELNKQKLLHTQTKQFYEETIEMLKSRQAQARDQLEQMNLSASREMDILRTSSTKEIDIFQSTNSELLLKISTLEHLILQRDEALQKLKAELQISREQIKGKQNLIVHLNQLELRNKLLQQTQSECQLLRIRLKKIEEQLKRVIKEKQQQTQFCRQYQTSALIAVQKTQHFQRLFQQQRSRNRQVTNDIQLLRAEKDDLRQHLQCFTRKITVEMGCQAEDNFLKHQLKAALQVIRQLEADYKRVTTEYEWQKRLRT